jgi:hypothetical protein
MVNLKRTVLVVVLAHSIQGSLRGYNTVGGRHLAVDNSGAEQTLIEKKRDFVDDEFRVWQVPPIFSFILLF